MTGSITIVPFDDIFPNILCVKASVNAVNPEVAINPTYNISMWWRTIYCWNTDCKEDWIKTNNPNNYRRNIFCNYIVFLIIQLACVNFNQMA